MSEYRHNTCVCIINKAAGDQLGTMGDTATTSKVPQPFIDAAERWARGQGTAEDHAVICAVSLGVALPLCYEATIFGFETKTRLPAIEQLGQYIRVRDDIRATAHAESEAAAKCGVLRAAISTSVPQNCTPSFTRACGTGVAAGAAQLFRASLAHSQAVWILPPVETFPAGADMFIYALRARGCTVQVDVEVDEALRIHCTYMSSLAILLAFFAAAGVKGDALSAGSISCGTARAHWRRQFAGVVCDAFGALGTLRLRARQRRRRRGSSSTGVCSKMLTSL